MTFQKDQESIHMHELQKKIKEDNMKKERQRMKSRNTICNISMISQLFMLIDSGKTNDYYDSVLDQDKQ